MEVQCWGSGSELLLHHCILWGLDLGGSSGNCNCGLSHLALSALRMLFHLSESGVLFLTDSKLTDLDNYHHINVPKSKFIQLSLNKIKVLYF